MAQSFSVEEAKQVIKLCELYQRQLSAFLKDYRPSLSSGIKKAAALTTNNTQLNTAIQNYLQYGGVSIPSCRDGENLLSLMYRFLHSTPSLNECNRLDKTYTRNIAYSIGNLKPITTPFFRHLTSKATREQAEVSYAYLKTIVEGEYGTGVQAAETELTTLPRQETVHADLEQNSSAYIDLVPTLLKEYYSTYTHSQWLDTILDKAAEIVSQYRNAGSILDNGLAASSADIRNIIDRQRMTESLKQLEQHDIETLSQYIPGLRVKTLRDAGYSTLADTYAATKANLASINGISSAAADQIKDETRKIVNTLTETSKFRIRFDEKRRNVGDTSLLRSLYEYMEWEKVRLAIEQLKPDIEKFQKAFESIKTATNNIQWTLSPDRKKRKVREQFQFLIDFLGGPVPDTLQKIPSGRNTHPNTPVDIWGDFSSRSIEYYNALEQIAPEVLGNDDTLYGLPEDLAREIQDQAFFPDGLKVTLRRYQEWGVKYILHQEKVLLGDEMGLGKTIQAIATMVSLRNTGATRFLVVCPASVLPNWCSEINKKSEFRATKIHGFGRQTAFNEWVQKGGVGVTTYETTSLLTLPNIFSIDLLIVDEAHYIKNAEAQRSKSVRQLCRYAKRILFMTGTALENKVDEMVSLIDVLQPALGKRVRNLAFMASAPQFREQIAPVYYRRKRDDVLTELPDVIDNEELCELLPEEEAEYENAVLRKDQTAIRRVSWGMDDIKKSSKARRMMEIIEDAEEDGRKLLVFSFYRETLQKIYRMLGSRSAQIINGSIPVERRQEIIDEFDGMPAGSVLPAQIQAGGTGLNIQSASVVIICEPQLKPSIENQAIARAHRMGQTRTVLVYRLIAEGTIDERIEEILREKQAIFDAFADPSVAAQVTETEEKQIDDKTFGKLIQEEIDRINGKSAVPAPTFQKRPQATVEGTSGSEPPTKPELVRVRTRPAAASALEKQILSPTQRPHIESSAGSISNQTSFSSIDELVTYLSRCGIGYKDNRDKSGCLWISADALPNGKEIRVGNGKLMYAKSSKALQGAPGWYIS